MTTGKTIALIRWTFVSKVMSLLLNTLSRFTIAFLTRSKHLLISHTHVHTHTLTHTWGFHSSPVVKNPPAMQDTWFWSPGWKDPLKKEMATHSSILAWEIPWREEPGRLQSMESQRVRHILATKPPLQLFRCLYSLSCYKIFNIVPFPIQQVLTVYLPISNNQFIPTHPFDNLKFIFYVCEFL